MQGLRMKNPQNAFFSKYLRKHKKKRKKESRSLLPFLDIAATSCKPAYRVGNELETFIFAPKLIQTHPSCLQKISGHAYLLD